MNRLQLEVLHGTTVQPVHLRVVRKRITLLEGEEKELSRKRQPPTHTDQDQCNQKVALQDMSQPLKCDLMKGTNKGSHQLVPKKNKQALKLSLLLSQLLQQNQHQQVPLLTVALLQVMVEVMLHPKALQPQQQQAHLDMGHHQQQLPHMEEAMLHPKVPLQQAPLPQQLVHIHHPIPLRPLLHLVTIPTQIKHLPQQHLHPLKSQRLHGRNLLAQLQHLHGRNQQQHQKKKKRLQ